MPWNLETFDHAGRPILETHYQGVLPPADLAAAVQATMAHAHTMAAPLLLGNAGGVYPQNLVYHKDAISFATADLIMPQGVDMASRQVHNGISMRIVRQYDINNDRMPCRIDVLYGYSVIRPPMAVRLWG